MTDFRRWFACAACLASSAGLAPAQIDAIRDPSKPLTCTASAENPRQLRPEAYSELLGDILITCTGGPALAAGTPVPTANLSVYVSPGVPVTSRVLDPASGVSEALLLVDAGSRNGANVYQGHAGYESANSVTFFNVPVLPPAYQGASRTFRIANIRVPTLGQPDRQPFLLEVRASSSAVLPVWSSPVLAGTVDRAAPVNANPASVASASFFAPSQPETVPEKAAGTAPALVKSPIRASGGPTQYLISTYAGGTPVPTAAVAASYPLGIPNGVATDLFGNTYISSSLNCVFRLDQNGFISLAAGNCQAGFSGDGASAVKAQLNNPQGLAVDVAGNLYIADQNNQRIRKVTPDGIISTLAGNGTAGFSGDNPSAIAAELNYPQGVAADAAGNVYIADQVNERVRKVALSGAITTVAGNGSFGRSGDNALAVNATFSVPEGVAVDAAGNLYIADQSNQIRKVNSLGIITHFAGTGAAGSAGDSGPAAVAQLNNPFAIVLDGTGNMYVADKSNGLIRKIDTNGIITTFAGGNSGVVLGDNGPATSARLYGPTGVSVDATGNVYIADKNLRVRKVDTSLNITTAAGTGASPFGGDGGPSGLAQMSDVWGIGRDATSGNIYVADNGNYRVRKIASTGIISTYAGTGACCDSIGGGAATGTGILPAGVTVDSAENVYFGDVAQIAKINLGDTISVEAGTGNAGSLGDGGPALSAMLSVTTPGLAADSQGNIYLSDATYHRVRKIATDQNINTVAGITGTSGYNGDGGLGTAEELNFPQGLAVDAVGDLYIADLGNSRIRKLALDGTLSTVAGNGTNIDAGDGGLATNASLNSPRGVAVDTANNLYIATAGNIVRMVSGGIINTIAGTGAAGYSGDGGPATAATLSSPYSAITDNSGNVYVADYGNGAVRALQPAGTAPVFTVSGTHASNFTAGQTGAYTITLSNAALARASRGMVTVTDTLPAGLTFANMSGPGWNCPSTQSVSNVYVCTRGDLLAPGGSYPITFTVNVTAAAQPQVTNLVSVTGGGSLGAASADPTLVGPATPVLQILSTHPNNFMIGQTNAVYTLYVANQAGAVMTSGPVTVTEKLPAALSLQTMNGGPTWNCSSNTCQRSDGLSGGNIYQPILVTVNVSSSAPAQVINQVTVSGGGSASATANDVTDIAIFQCSLDKDGIATVSNVQTIINEALGLSPLSHDLNQDGAVNVADIQMEINAVLGLGCPN